MAALSATTNAKTLAVVKLSAEKHRVDPGPAAVGRPVDGYLQMEVVAGGVSCGANIRYHIACVDRLSRAAVVLWQFSKARR
jgi:hypothetical protein